MSCWLGHGNGAEHTLEHTDIALLCALQSTTNVHTDDGKGREARHQELCVYVFLCMFVAQIIFTRGTYGDEVLSIS